MLVKTPSLPIPVGGRLSGDNVLVSHSFVGDGRADRHRFERRLGIVDDVARELDLDGSGHGGASMHAPLPSNRGAVIRACVDYLRLNTTKHERPRQHRAGRRPP